MKTQVAKQSLVLGTLTILATTFGASAIAPVQAQSKSTWKNLAIGGAAVTGYGLLKKKKGVAIIGGLGTAYAYSRYNSKNKAEKRAAENRRTRWYKSRYGKNWRTYYKPGV
ncbi:MAG: hypothetical protein EOP04_33805 [Proteobacteria bacterium]|nr:MAG: hypothetical protein EOP04_33805 [Pseudomonadota bacterium]